MVRPPLSVVLAARGGWAAASSSIEVVAEQMGEVGGELVVVTGVGDFLDLGPNVRWISTHEQCLHTLRARGVCEARGDVIAIGEDHAFAQHGWAEQVIRTHGEHPEADIVVGCLVNATNQTLAGRVNFFAFAAPWSPPMPVLRTRRPPPISAVSMKRRVFLDYRGRPGELEASLLPRLLADGVVVVDDGIRVDHYQDHGMRWTIRNAFDSARSSYGLLESTNLEQRRKRAQWAISHVPRALFVEARNATEARTHERLACLPIVAAAGLGAAIGALAGPGRASHRVA